MRRFVLLLMLVLVSAGTSAAQPAARPAGQPDPAPGYTPERVFDSDRKAFTDFESMLAELSYADVVFVGEQHDDPNTHRLEFAVLDGLARRRGNIVLSLEMFERDVQAVVDDYLAGRTTEEAFLKASRPWPRYQTDYRPLVEFARARGWSVVAANVPRPLANAVSKAGLAHLDSLSPGARAHASRDLDCPFDDYFDRFDETMNAHPMPGAEKQSAEEKRQMTERFYFAQCVKDETMAESIAGAYQRVAESRPLVVHFNGSFHSDFGWGTAARVERRLDGARVKILTVWPVADLDRLKPSKDDRKVADYLVYTLDTRKRETNAGR